MTVRGKRGNPKPGFPLFPPPLEIADDFHIPTGPTHPVYTHQRRPNTSEKCYPCRRAKVLPMSPTVHRRIECKGDSESPAGHGGVHSPFTLTPAVAKEETPR